MQTGALPFTIRNRPFGWLSNFLGTSSIATMEMPALAHQQYLGFFNENKDVQYRLKAGKVWMILIGMEMENVELLARGMENIACRGRQAFNDFTNAPHSSTLPTFTRA